LQDRGGDISAGRSVARSLPWPLSCSTRDRAQFFNSLPSLILTPFHPDSTFYLVQMLFHSTEFLFLHYTFFVTFFPQLIAGLIAQQGEILGQLCQNESKRSWKNKIFSGALKRSREPIEIRKKTTNRADSR
jgi:hypothetical protein